MYYYDKETAINKVKTRINNYKKCLALIEELKPVVKRFDGKIYNVKFDRALKEVCDYINVDFEYSSFDIKVLTYMNGNGGGRNSAKAPVCMNGSEYYYLTSRLGTRAGGYGICPFEETETGKRRIIADKIIEGLDYQAEYYNRVITENSEGLKHIDEYAAKVAEIERRVKELEEIPHDIKNYFDWNLYIKNYY